MSSWACPKCSAAANKCGKGGRETCARNGGCGGFLCECEDDTPCDNTHGESEQDPCLNARCYHCGWQGRFPVSTKKLTGWQKKAWEAGWCPPQSSLDNAPSED